MQSEAAQGQAEGVHPERVNKSELAKILGCAKSNISKYVKKGRLVFDADGRIDLRAARAALENKDPARQLAKESAAPPKDDTAAAAYRDAKADEAAARAELTRMKLGIQSGQYLKKDRVEQDMADCGRKIRQVIDLLPTKADEAAAELGVAAEDLRKLFKRLARETEQAVADALLQAQAGLADAARG